MALPKPLPLQAMQTTWATALDPVISNPIVNGLLLQEQSLTTGANIINHKLGRKLVGWYVTRMRGVAASIYDTQDNNQTPQLTLNLNASTPVVCDLWVF